MLARRSTAHVHYGQPNLLNRLSAAHVHSDCVDLGKNKQTNKQTTAAVTTTSKAKAYRKLLCLLPARICYVVREKERKEKRKKSTHYAL